MPEKRLDWLPVRLPHRPLHINPTEIYPPSCQKPPFFAKLFYKYAICRVTIDVTPCYYTKTVESYRILIAKPKIYKKELNRHEYNTTFSTIFAT